MKISAKERAGLRAMVEFARHYGKGPISIRQVAQAEALPLPYLEQIVLDLRRAGLLTSVRGPRGGYLLARDPATLSVGDIFRAVEGELMSVNCTRTDGSPCARESFCATRSIWQTVFMRVTETLDRTSLADLLRDAEPAIPTKGC